MEGKDLLKFMAQQAKNRLTGKKDKIMSIKYGRSYIQNSKDNIKTIIIEEDKELENKMKNLVESDCFNPINELIDFSYYKTLTKEQKERYFFVLAEKYRKYKEEYLNEKCKQA